MHLHHKQVKAWLNRWQKVFLSDYGWEDQLQMRVLDGGTTAFVHNKIGN